MPTGSNPWGVMSNVRPPVGFASTMIPMNRYHTPVAVAGAVLAALARLVPLSWTLPNLAPVGALALYSGARVAGWQAFLLPVGVMAVSDAVLHLTRGYGWSPLVYACYLGYALVGRCLRGRVSVVNVAAAGLACDFTFFLVTNAACWPGNRLYSQDFAGLVACITAGLPFFKYTLLGSLVFVPVLFLAPVLLAKLAPAPAPVEVDA